MVGRLGEGPRTKQIDTIFFWCVEEREQDGDPSQYQESFHSEKLRRRWNEASLCFSTTTALQLCGIGILLTMDPTPHNKRMGDMLKRAGARMCNTERHGQLSDLVLLVETGAKLVDTICNSRRVWHLARLDLEGRTEKKNI